MRLLFWWGCINEVNHRSERDRPSVLNHKAALFSGWAPARAKSGLFLLSVWCLRVWQKMRPAARLNCRTVNAIMVWCLSMWNGPLTKCNLVQTFVWGISAQLRFLFVYCFFVSLLFCLFQSDGTAENNGEQSVEESNALPDVSLVSPSTREGWEW